LIGLSVELDLFRFFDLFGSGFHFYFSCKKGKLVGGRVSPVKSRAPWFFNGFLEIISGRLWTTWMSGKTVIRINQLSYTKVYPQVSVNKRITALFESSGIYYRDRKIYI